MNWAKLATWPRRYLLTWTRSSQDHLTHFLTITRPKWLQLTLGRHGALGHPIPRPIDLVNGGLWGIGPHWGLGRVKWMVEYWRRHGGEA